MGVDPALLWWAMLSLPAMSAAWVTQRCDTHQDDSIGKLKLDDDILGAPISKEEFEASLRISITVPEGDPAPTSGYFQGDIIIESQDRSRQTHRDGPIGQNSAMRDTDRRWPRGVIPYVISASYSSKDRLIIARAMVELSRVSCLSFKHRTYHRDYVHIAKGKGCASRVGRRTCRQGLSLESPGCLYVGVVMHEFMHAAGFWHEHCRSDRDEYVIINEDNIKDEDKKHNFEKKSNRESSDLGLPYDYDSIMHYGRYAFTNGKGPTIEPRQSGVTIGQREGLSAYDMEGLNQLYNCSDPSQPPSCTDTNPRCPVSASDERCSPKHKYIRAHCRKSCSDCDSTRFSCQDNAHNCPYWAAAGRCTSRYVKDVAYMMARCRKSCGVCESPPSSSPCEDNNQYCYVWAAYGHCDSEYDEILAYMMAHCGASCGVCDYYDYSYYEDPLARRSDYYVYYFYEDPLARR